MNTKWIKERFDTSFSKEVMEGLASITDNPELGGRTAGSPAEHRAAEYLANKFKEAGLQNVTKDPCPVDSWTLKEASLAYQDKAGKTRSLPLGGYACNLQCMEKEFSMIFAKKGREKDYEDADPKGKLVLLEINQADDWWINFPAYEAKARGAAGIICINTGGFGQEGDNVLVSQDICGPADLVAFSIGQKDGAELKRAIEKSVNGEISVCLTADSVVSEGGTSYNIWGDIPGKTDEVLYVINHYDSYYYTVYDDVQGIGLALGLAKAFADHGYRPQKTIRFVAHGAEEWGMIDSKYDWAIGAYRQITDIRPEWAETGFAAINLDGFYAVKGEHRFCIVCTKELYDFVEEAVQAYGDTGEYAIEVNMKLTSSTEDFSYTKAGIPSFVAGAYDGCLADRKVLHSSDSGWESGFDDKAFELFHSLFAHIIVEMDERSVCPINLLRRLSMIFESIKGDLPEESKAAFTNAIKEAENLNQSLAQLKPVKGAAALNRELHDIYKRIHENFIRLDWNDEMIAPHQRFASNLKALETGRQAAESSNYQEAVTQFKAVDFNYYADFFSEDTCTYFEKQVTEFSRDSWGTGLIEHGNENLFALIRALKAGDYGEAEKSRIKKALENQSKWYYEAIAAEVSAASEIGKMIKRLNYAF